MKLKLPIIGEINTGKDASATIGEVKQSKTKILDVLGGMLEFGEQRLSSDKTISTKLLAANRGWVYRNNDAIAQEVSKVEFELYTVGLSGGEIVYNEVETHPLLDLLDRPNQETTKNDAMYIIQSHKKLTGDAFWVKLRDGKGQVVALRTLPPDKVKLVLQSPTEKDPTVIQSYNYVDKIDGNEIDIKYDPKDIIHFKKPNPNNAFRGIGAVEPLAETIDLDNLTDQTTLSFLKKGAIQNFALTTDSKITDDQLKRLKAEMRATTNGQQNAYSTPIFGGGLKPVDISYSSKDQEFLAKSEWYRDKIMYMFGNTKASLGMVDDVNRASFEGSNIGWLRNTVKPDMEAIVNTLNEFLVPEFGANLVLGFCDPVPEDRADDILEANDLYKNGIIMRSEARELLDYDYDTSDEVYFSTGLATLTPDTLVPVDKPTDDIGEEDED
jgi:HK97 family phage portal protein